jgi:hypothetical protein
VGVHSVGRHGLLCWQGAADRPVAAIFRFLLRKTAVSVHTVALTGRRLTQAVGLAAFSVSGFSSAPHGLRPSAVLMNRRAPHITAHVIFARRPAFSLLPATVCTSHTPRMLRPRSSWRFASACTARHGSFLPCLAVWRALPKALQRVCAD